MKQQKRRLCTVLLCVILTITNILSAGMPVYAKTVDIGTNAGYTDETTSQQEELPADEASDTSGGGQDEEDQENQDTPDPDGGIAGDSESDDNDVESRDDSESEDDSNANQDSGVAGDPDVDDESDTDIDTDPGDESDADVDTNESTVGDNTDGDAESEETVAGDTQLYASGDYPIDDTQGYALSDVVVTPGSYSAEFSAVLVNRKYSSQFSTRDNDTGNIVVVYTTDEEKAADFFKESSSINISKADLNSIGFKAAESEGWDEDFLDADSFYLSGTFVGDSFLAPDTTYYYRLAHHPYWSEEYYFLTVPDAFNTKPAIAETSVSIRDIQIEETGYANAKIVWTIDNPGKETLFDMGLYYAADGDEYSTYSLRAYPYRDDNWNIVPDKYYAEISNLTGNYKAYAEVSVYTGQSTKTPVKSDEIKITPRDFKDAKITLTEKAGSSSFAVSINLTPRYAVDSYINARLYYRADGTENWLLSSEYDYLNSSNNGTAFTGTITVSGLSENTDYEYYIELAGRTVDSLGIPDSPRSISTKEIVTYSDDDFPDDEFRSFIRKQIKISDDEDITSDKLERLTELYYFRSNASSDIESLEGIEYIENLTLIDFEGHAITNLGNIDRLTNLENIGLRYNDLTELPDLSGLSMLKFAGFDGNKIDPSTITASRLPESFLASNSDWINRTRQNQRGEVTSQLAPEYYTSGEARPFLIKVTGLKGDYNRKYTLTLTVDGNSVSYKDLQYEYYGVYYIADILKNSSGGDSGIVFTDGKSCTADITLTDNYGNTYVNLTGQQLNFVAGGSGPVAETRYIKPDAKSASISIKNLSASLEKSDIQSIELKNAKGEKVGDANLSEVYIYSSYYNPYEDIFGYFYISDMANQQSKQLSATVYLAKYLDSGDYTAVINMADGTVLSVENAVHVENAAVLTSLYTTSQYDSYGDYLYLSAYGVNIDPSKVWPVLYEGNETVTKVVSSTVGFERTSAVYKLEKLKKDTYWSGTDEITFNYRLETAAGYKILDKTTDKTITLYAPYSGRDFVLFEHYNYKKGVYEVNTDSTVANGTKVSVSVYSDSNRRNLKGTAEGEIKDSMLSLEFKDESGETYAPPRNTASYFSYSYKDADGKNQTFNHQEYVEWYNYYTSGSGTTANVTSNMFLYQEKVLKSLGIDVSFSSTLVSSDQEVSAQIYTSSGSAVGSSVTMKGSTGSNGYVRFTGTWKDDTGLDSGVYTIRYRLADSNSVLYTQTLYVYANDTFYMNGQYFGTWTSGSKSGVYVDFGSEQLYGNYVNKYSSKVSDADALKIWNSDGYKLEIFDRLGNEIKGWSIDHASWSGWYFYLYLANLSEDYTGYYVKITRNGKTGIRLDTKAGYYASAYDGNEQYGVWHSLYSGFSYYTGDYAYVGFTSSDIKAYPVTVTIRRPYDTDVITSFKASSPTSGNTYYFTESDLSKTKTDEVYELVLEGNDGIVGTTTCYLATRNQSTIVDATGISLDKTKLNMQLGRTEKLTATVKPDNASNKSVTWTSSDEAVVTVEQGTVTANGAGTATITASTHNGKTATCTVQVFNYSISQTTMELFLPLKTTDDQRKLTVNNGKDDITSSVTWSSNDVSVAKVSKGGVVTPIGAGTAKILAAIKNGPTLICDVTVYKDEKPEVSLSDSACTLNAGDTKQLKLFLTPSDTTAVSAIEWASKDDAVASVTPLGADPAKSLTALVTANAKGETEITVTVITKSDDTNPTPVECDVVVKAVTTAKEAEEAKANISSKLTALTNEQLKLGDVELPKDSGWTWMDDRIELKQFAGMQSKHFVAQYRRDADAEPYTTDLPVALSTVTGISISAESSSIHVEDIKELSVICNWKGEELDMSQYDDKVSWSIDKPSVASLSSQKGFATTVTGVAAGKATITAKMKFKGGEYKATYKVTVTDGDIADIQVVSADPFTPDDGDSSVYNGNVTSGSGTISVNVDKATKLTVKCNNTKVIAVGKVTSANQNYTIPFTVKAAGVARITLTANDAAKTKKDIWLHVTDAKPNISANTVTVNLQKTTGTTFYLYPNAGYKEVTEAKLAGEKADRFTLTHDTESDSYVIKAKPDTIKGSYKLSLEGKVRTQQGDDQDYKGVTFTVKVVNQAPKYKVKQSAKVNLFYTDAASLLEITSDETLIGAELSDCDFTFREGSHYIIPSKEGLGTNCDKKGTLTLRFQGYKDVTANYMVNVEKNAPKIALVSTSATLYPNMGLNSATVKVKGVLDNGTTVALNDARFSFIGSDGEWLLTGSDLTKQETVKAKLTFRNSSWVKEVTKSYTIKVNMGTPAAKLQKSTLQLNTNTASKAYDAASTKVMWKYGAEFNPLGVSVSAANTKAQGIINKGVVFTFDPVENKVIAKLNNTTVAKGTYKFRVNVQVTDTVTVTTPLKVKIVDVTMNNAIKVSSKGKIDVLNRENTYVTVTPALKSLNGTIVGASLSGRAAHLFDAEHEDNKVIIHAKSDKALITKYNYKVQIDLTIENAEGDTIRYTTPEINIKLKQGNPKVSITPKTTTFFSGAYNSMTQDISAALKGAENPVITDVELMNNKDAFECSYGDGIITLTHKQGTVKGKTYSLQFKVTYDGQADNEKATTVKYSVKVK